MEAQREGEKMSDNLSGRWVRLPLSWLQLVREWEGDGRGET